MSGWIKLEDKLPDHGELVVVICNGVVQYSLASLRYGKWTWKANMDADYAPEEYVSHWIPLPEIPK